jgi:hypothetical protein
VECINIPLGGAKLLHEPCRTYSGILPPGFLTNRPAIASSTGRQATRNMPRKHLVLVNGKSGLIIHFSLQLPINEDKNYTCNQHEEPEFNGNNRKPESQRYDTHKQFNAKSGQEHRRNKSNNNNHDMTHVRFSPRIIPCNTTIAFTERLSNILSKYESMK